jgi:hypothetical protein
MTLPELPIELVSSILMMRESPKHAELINTHESEHAYYWEDGQPKYTIFENLDSQIHKIGAPAMIGWDRDGNKVVEEWVKRGVPQRSGCDRPTRTFWDSNGKVSHEAWFTQGELTKTEEHSHGGAKVWSRTYEVWVDRIVGMDAPGPKYVLEDDTGRLHEYPESMLEFMSIE